MWADENSQKKVYPCTKNVVTFRKFVVHRKRIGWNIVHGIIFKGRTAADDVGKPSSRLPRDLVMRQSWSRGCRHFLSYLVSTHILFSILSLLPLSKFWYYTLTYCLVPYSISWIVSSIDWLENITDQFVKMSGQSDTGTYLSDVCGFVRIRFQINHFRFFRTVCELYSQTGHYWL